MKIPCEKCITLAICKNQVCEAEGLTILIFKCLLFRTYLRKIYNVDSARYGTINQVREFFGLDSTLY